MAQGCCVRSAADSSNTRTFISFVKTLVRMVAEAGKELHESDSSQNYKEKSEEYSPQRLGGRPGRKFHSSNKGFDEQDDATDTRPSVDENNSDIPTAANGIFEYPNNSSGQTVIDVLLSNFNQDGSEPDASKPEYNDDELAQRNAGPYVATTPKSKKTICFEPKQLLDLHRRSLRQDEDCEDLDTSLELRNNQVLARRGLLEKAQELRSTMERMKDMAVLVKDKLPYMTEQLIALRAILEKNRNRKDEDDKDDKDADNTNSELMKLVIKVLLTALKEKYLSKPTTNENESKTIQPKLDSPEETKPETAGLKLKPSVYPAYQKPPPKNDLEQRNTLESLDIDPDYFDELYPEDDFYDDYKEDPYNDPEDEYSLKSYPVNNPKTLQQLGRQENKKMHRSNNIEPLKGYADYRPKTPAFDRRYPEQWRH